MNKFSKFGSVAGALVVVLASATVADAGGVVGCKGSGSFIRGSVGCALAPVQKQITPTVRNAVVAGGAAAGSAAAAWLGAPPQVGAQMGAMVGQAVNNAARGGHGSAQMQQPMQVPAIIQPVQTQPVFAQPAWQGGMVPQPQVTFGNFCQTPYGRVGPGMPNPIGSPCTGFVPGVGPVPGQVGF